MMVVAATAATAPAAGAEAGDRAAPRALAEPVRGRRAERALHAGAFGSAVHPGADVVVPGGGAELGLERIDGPAAAVADVQQAGHVDLVRAAGLGAVDEPLADGGLRPGAGGTAGPGVDRRLPDAVRSLEPGDRP